MERDNNIIVADIKDKVQQSFHLSIKDQNQQNIQSNISSPFIKHDKINFEDYLKAKYEKNNMVYGGMQKVNNLNLSSQKNYMDKFQSISPPKQRNNVSSLMINIHSPTSNISNKYFSPCQKVTLKSIITNQLEGDTTGLSQHKLNSTLKNKSLYLQQDDNQQQMKGKLRNEQWTSTINLQNLRSAGKISSDYVSQSISPAKFRVSMPIVEQMQKINQQEKKLLLKKNIISQYSIKQMNGNGRVNQKTSSMKNIKINSLDMLNKSPQNKDTQFTDLLNSPSTRQNILKQKDQIEENSIICKSSNKKQKNLSLDEFNFNFGQDEQIQRSQGQINQSNSQLNHTHNQLNNTNTQINQQYKENSSEQNLRNVFNKTNIKIKKNIKFQSKNNSQQEINQSDHQLNSLQELQQIENISQSNKGQTVKSKSEKVIQANQQRTQNLNKSQQNLKNNKTSSMLSFQVQEEDNEETIPQNRKTKAISFMKIQSQNEVHQNSYNNLASNNQICNSSQEKIIDENCENKINTPQNSLTKKHQLLYRQKSNFVTSSKSNSNQQTQQELNSQMTQSSLESTKNLVKIQQKNQSPANRKELLIQQIFMQKLKNRQQSNIFTNNLQKASFNSPINNTNKQETNGWNQFTQIKQQDNLPILNQSKIPQHDQQINQKQAPTVPPINISLNFQRSTSFNQNEGLDESIQNTNTPSQISRTQTSVGFTQPRNRQISSIEFSSNGGYQQKQDLLSQILKKSIQQLTTKALNESIHSQSNNTSSTPFSKQKKKTKNINQSQEIDANGYFKGDFEQILIDNAQISDRLSPQQSQQQNDGMNKKNLNSSNQLRFAIDELCQGLELYMSKDIDLMREIKQNEIDSNSFNFYVTKYLQLIYDVQNNIKQKDRLVLFKISTQTFEKLKQILNLKMNDMNLEQPMIDKIIKLFEENKSYILASNVYEEIGGKKHLRTLIQSIVQEIRENSNVQILNQFNDQKSIIDNSTLFFTYLFKGDYNKVEELSKQLIENKYSITLIEFFLLKSFSYSSLIKQQSVNKEIAFRVLEKIEQARCFLLPYYDDNITLFPESRISSLLFDLGMNSTPVHKFIKPMKSKYQNENLQESVSLYLKLEVKYLITQPKLRKMARISELYLKSKDDFQIVTQSFMDILKKQKSVRLTYNQLLNIEVRIMKVAILIGLEEDYLGLFKDINEIQESFKDEINQYFHQNSSKLNIQYFKQSLDIQFICFVIELAFNQYGVFNAYDIQVVKKFYSLNDDVLNIQISSFESLLLKRRKTNNQNFMQKPQKVSQFINILKKIFFQN